MSLFKKESITDEVLLGMEKNLTDIGGMKDKIDSLDALAATAELCDRKGLYVEAELLTKMLEAVANNSTEEFKRLQQNLLETGTLFAQKDYADSDDELNIDDKDEDQVSSMLSSFDDEE